MVGLKGLISLSFGVFAIGFGLARFALKWLVNPVLGLSLSLAGLAINAGCAILLRPKHDDHHHHHHEQDHQEDHTELGKKKLKKVNWKHTISDLASGSVNVGFGALEIILQAAKEEIALKEAVIEGKLREANQRIDSLEESVNKDLAHIRETYNGEIRNLGQKIEDLRSELRNQHGSLVQLLTKLIDNTKD